MTDATDPSPTRRHSAAAERNCGPILGVLGRVLPATGTALEVASGTGQHVAHFARHLPGWQWQPSDPQPESLASIAAWCTGLANVAAPLRLDVLDAGQALGACRFDAVYCANMLHIAPWATCAALMALAATHLAPRGQLVVYGPFIVDGVVTAPGNLAFDADLRARDPAWGLRTLGDVERQANAHGLRLGERIDMPANNLVLVFDRGG